MIYNRDLHDHSRTGCLLMDHMAARYLDLAQRTRVRHTEAATLPVVAGSATAHSSWFAPATRHRQSTLYTLITWQTLDAMPRVPDMSMVPRFRMSSQQAAQ